MSSPPVDSPLRRHLIIGGTGRAGTTFLVRYLTALGLDTHLARRGADAWLDEQAQAGLEDFPFGPDASDLPYVIKNPMLYEFIDQVIDGGTMIVDGVIIPVRNLREAASSRAILERRSMYEHLPWLGYMDKAWDTVANVPGGLVQSLEVLDEARILAVGLHLLVERLVRANIPMVFLDFPRIVNDADYLYDKLEPFLPATTRAAAQSVHFELAQPEKVRTEREVHPSDSPTGDSLDEKLDRIALRRELVRLQSTLAARTAERDEARGALEIVQAHLSRPIGDDVVRFEQQIGELEVLRSRAWDDAVRLQNQLELQTAEFEKLHPLNETLKSRNLLLAAQLEVLTFERTELERHCRRLEQAISEARERAITAERTVTDYLSAFVDDVGKLAAPDQGIAHVLQAREHFTSMLSQLEAASADLAETTKRLLEREPFVARILARLRSTKAR